MIFLKMSEDDVSFYIELHKYRARYSFSNRDGSPQLFASTDHFRELERIVKKRARSEFPTYRNLLKMQSKMFKFTPDDWHVFLCAFSALSDIGQQIYFQHNDSATSTRMVIVKEIVSTVLIMFGH